MKKFLKSLLLTWVIGFAIVGLTLFILPLVLSTTTSQDSVVRDPDVDGFGNWPPLFSLEDSN